jgi:Uri superfamily endonuclease
MKGIYVLILKMEEEKNINVGKLGQFIFERSYYAYVGSALGGFYRLERHLRSLKKGSVEKEHWHIDFIIPCCRFMGYFFAEGLNPGLEEKLANLLSKKLNYVKGFGASDSRAPSHLFVGDNLKNLKDCIKKSLKSLNITNIQYCE